MLSPKLTSWKMQYDRMMRSYECLIWTHRTAHEYDDDIQHFFQDCWHLKDWLENDEALSLKNTLYPIVMAHPTMHIVRDLANASKHLRRDRGTGTGAYVTNTDVTIGGDPRGGAIYTYWVTLADGTQHIATEIAHDAIMVWDRILLELQLLKPA